MCDTVDENGSGEEEVHGKTLLTSEESLLNLGSVPTSKQLTLVHNNVLTLYFQNRKVWINRSPSFQGVSAIDI